MLFDKTDNKKGGDIQKRVVMIIVDLLQRVIKKVKVKVGVKVGVLKDPKVCRIRGRVLINKMSQIVN